MKKILKDRKNSLKSKLKDITSAKMGKRVDEELAIGLLHRIQEIEWVLAKLEKTKTAQIDYMATLLAQDEYLTFEEAKSIVDAKYK